MLYPMNPFLLGRDEAGRVLAFVLQVRRARLIADRDIGARSRVLQRIKPSCCLILALVLALVRGPQKT